MDGVNQVKESLGNWFEVEFDTKYLDIRTDWVTTKIQQFWTPF